MGLADVKNELNRFDKKQMIELLTDLCKKNVSVKECLDFFVSPNEVKLLTKYKTKVLEAFYPKRGDEIKLRDGRNAITESKSMGYHRNRFVASCCIVRNAGLNSPWNTAICIKHFIQVSNPCIIVRWL